MAVLESDLRALSAEARRRYPAVKDGAEHAILKVSIYILLFCNFFSNCLFIWSSFFGLILIQFRKFCNAVP